MVDFKVEMEFLQNCPVCNSDRIYYEFTHPALELDVELSIFFCPNCHTCFHNPRMTKENMVEYYESGVYAIKHKINNDGEINRAVNRTQLVRHSSVNPPTRCLDVGCAQGYLLDEMHKEFGCETVGFDYYVDDRAIREIITDKDEITGTFDFISCMHVLEHMHDPMSELKWMGSLLEDDGVMLLEVPLFRKISLAHPIMFSQGFLGYMMKYIGIDSFTVMVSEDKEVGIVMGVK